MFPMRVKFYNKGFGAFHWTLIRKNSEKNEKWKKKEIMMKIKRFFIYTGKATAQMGEIEITNLNYIKHSQRFK